MAKSTPSISEDTKTDVSTTETGVWGGVGRKMKVMIKTPLKGKRYVMGKTGRKIIVEDADTKTDVTTVED